MNKKILLAIGATLLFVNESICQTLDWKSTLAPRARHITAGHILQKGDFYIFGGNPTNDSIQFIGHSTDTGSTWGIKTDAPFKPQIYDANFVGQDIAFAIGDAGLILKSVDGGDNWTPQSVVSNLRSRQFRAIHNVSQDTAYIVGGNLSNDSITTMLRTVNGGANWQKKMDKPGPRLNDVHFYGSNDGIAVGNNGIIYMTNDGGENWGPKTIPGNAGNRTFTAARFISKNTILIIGGHPSNDSIQTILKSNDAGNSWQIIKDNLDPMLLDIDFLPNQSTGIAVGNDGKAYSTSDTGNTWNEINLPMNNGSALNSINYINAKNAIIGGQFGTVYYAFDGNSLDAHSIKRKEERLTSNPILGDVMTIKTIRNYSKFELISTTGKRMQLNRLSPNKFNIAEVPTGIYVLSCTDLNGNFIYQKIQKL